MVVLGRFSRSGLIVAVLAAVVAACGKNGHRSGLPLRLIADGIAYDPTTRSVLVSNKGEAVKYETLSNV